MRELARAPSGVPASRWPPSNPAPARIGGPRARRARAEQPELPYLNRELSWLEFNARVLHEARDVRNPLLERVKFLAIFAGNLDEFFQVRIAGLRQQIEAGAVARAPDGRTPRSSSAAARERVLTLIADHSAIFIEVRQALAAEGIEIVDYASIPEHHAALRQRFLDEIFPVLTPLAVDPGHPFPYISTLSLSIAVGPARSGDRRARLRPGQGAADPAPPARGRADPFRARSTRSSRPTSRTCSPGWRSSRHHLFRVTRNADFTVEEDEADDLLMAIEEELRRRRFGEAVRLEVERTMPAATRTLLHARPGPGGRRLLRDRGHARPDRAVAASPSSTGPTCAPRRGPR